LEKEKVSVVLLSPFHYATLYNIFKLLLLRLKGYQIFHIHFEYIFPFIFLTKIIIKLLKKMGYKIIWTIHDISKDYKYSNKRLRSNKKSRWLYQNSDYKFVHYKSNIEKLKDCFNVEISNVDVIFHPYFSYPNVINREDARRKLGIPLNKKVILSFGLIKKYKGHIELIEAFERLKIDDLLCLIVGSGSQDTETTKYIKNKSKQLNNLIIIDKYIPKDEIQIYFNASDIVVLPYRNITQSGIIPLAYSFSKPVIATNVGVLSEMIKNEITGLIIPSNNIDLLANSINKMLKMDYKQMGINAYNESRKYSWEKLAKQTKKIYSKLI
jgi:glycosyltransferase involved in cell wall biosynthesis